MRVYEFTAPLHEIGYAALFLGFFNEATGQYLWVQREELTEADVVPHAGNVWIERDDQGWGGHGGITGVELGRDTLSVRLTPAKADWMGGYDEFRVRLSLTDDEFAAVRGQLLRVFIGYESMVRVPAEPGAAADGPRL